MGPKHTSSATLPRRDFLRRSAAAGVSIGIERGLPAVGRRLPLQQAPAVIRGGSGDPILLTIGETEVSFHGRVGRATTINGTLPGPLIRFREGDEAEIHVTNTLDEGSSIHWHGILLPNGMDGVPGINFPGIRPRETFVYRFPLRQRGTYWYHSHSGLQEQSGMYAPLVIDPPEGALDPVEPADREHVIVLSDWTFEDPHRVLARLRKHPDYYNHQKRTVLDFFRDVAARGLGWAVGDRLEWGAMRMNPTDIADITGATYTYLLNGRTSGAPWEGLFEPGERVRLRIVNASAATFFDFRIPGLPLTVVEADGQPVLPVQTDELRIAIAETYDLIVEPQGRAYPVYAEAMDRSGFAAGTLAPRSGMSVSLPERRDRPLLTMDDMGMSHDMADMEGMPEPAMDMPGMDRPGMDPPAGHDMPMAMGPEAGMEQAPGMLPAEAPHGPDDHGVGNAGVAMVARSLLHEPGRGLGGDGWRVLTYADLEARDPWPGFRAPDREIEMHLTGNMERFMWSIDGVPFADAAPVRVALGERIRLTMVNDTMMNHPMHLHGMWMELENGKGDRIPRAHTVNVKPAEKVSVLFTADAPGPWAFHCHVLYHMHSGMFRVVDVVEATADLAGAGGDRL